MGNRWRSLSCSCVTILMVATGCSEPDASSQLATPLPIRTIVEPDTGFYQELSWSADGLYLVLSVLQAGGEGGFEYRLMRVNVNGEEYVPITNGPRDYWTSWSPNGARVLFGSERDGNTDIYSVRPDGTDLIRLTDDPGRDTQPAWSPDGSRIAFVSNRDGEQRIYMMSADGADQRILSPTIHGAETPTWSPDGRRIAYFQSDAAGNDSIAVVAVDGTVSTILTAGVWPSWSPDGSRIIYGREEGLFEISADGGESHRIEHGGMFARFSPDGEFLASIGKEGGDVVVTIQRANGSEPRVLLRRPAPVW